VQVLDDDDEELVGRRAAEERRHAVEEAEARRSASSAGAGVAPVTASRAGTSRPRSDAPAPTSWRTRAACVRANQRRITWIHGQYAGAPPSPGTVPTAPRPAPARRARLDERRLPMPASPVTSTTRLRPARVGDRRAQRVESSRVDEDPTGGRLLEGA
jgi:hypothetical protein